MVLNDKNVFYVELNYVQIVNSITNNVINVDKLIILF